MKNIKEEVLKLQNEMLDDIWEYRKDILSEIGITEKEEVKHKCLDLDVDDEYCSLSWEMGYVYALKEALKIIEAEKTLTADEILTDCEKQILDKEGEEALMRYKEAQEEEFWGDDL